MTAESYIASVHVDADPERVFEYFIDSSRLTRWMGRRADLDPKPGGRFNLDVYRINVRGQYMKVDRPHRILLSWGHEGSEILPPGASTVEVTFTPQGGGTLVRVVHSNLPESEVAKHETGWQHFLPRLAVIAAGEDPGTDPWALSRVSTQLR